MHSDRQRSIIPMFGGGYNFVETLMAIVRFVNEADPTTERLGRCHRDRFARASSADSITRRMRSLESVGFLSKRGGRPYRNENAAIV
jgi:putative restriction endonuclease